MGRSRLVRIRRAELRDYSIPEGSNRLHELPVRFQKGCTLEQELLPQLRGEDGWRCADVSVLVIVLVVLLLLADSLIFFIIGAAYTTGKTVKTLRDKGWSIEPPKDEDVYQ